MSDAPEHVFYYWDDTLDVDPEPMFDDGVHDGFIIVHDGEKAHYSTPARVFSWGGAMTVTDRKDDDDE
jgi:hypothetical protein